MNTLKYFTEYYNSQKLVFLITQITTELRCQSVNISISTVAVHLQSRSKGHTYIMDVLS